MLLSDDFLRTMIDQMPALAWSCRPDGSAEFVNQRWLDYTGLSMEEAVGWGWQATIHPEDLGKTMETGLRLVASEEPGEEEARVRRFDGEYRWFLFQTVPVRDERRKVIRWYGTSIDIEDRKRAEEKLRQSEGYLSEAQRLSHTGSFGWRVSTEEILWSEETFRIFQYDPTTKPTAELILQPTHRKTFSVDETWLKNESPREASSLGVSASRLLRLDEDQEREMIEAALAESKGRVAGPFGAAGKLGIPRQTLESKIANLGINKNRFKSA